MSRITLRDAVAGMPFSRSELARRAGVSRTTALTASEDTSRARVDTLRELALALGYDVAIELDRASDPLAAAAARVLLGDLDPDERAQDRRDLDMWIERLRRYTGGERLDLITEAARVSGPRNRAGSILMQGRVDADRLVSVGRASGARWVLSGAATLDALGADEATTVVLWSEDAAGVAALLAATHRRVRVETAANLIIAPAHPTVFVGSTTVEDVELVSPLQGIIDAVATGGVDREIAEAIARSW